MEKFFDAHCHLKDSAFIDYRGAGRFICNAANVTDWPGLIAAAGKNKHIYAAIGVHPWNAANAGADMIACLRRILSVHMDIMVGEIGLDHTRGAWGTQVELFQGQYIAAADFGRATHIHCVRAWDEMLRVLKNMPHPPAVVFHRFAGSPEIVASVSKLLNGNAYFSYRDATTLRDVRAISVTPMDKILVETDGYAPAPELVFETVRKIAQIKNIAPEKMAEIVYNNAYRVIENGQIAQNA